MVFVDDVIQDGLIFLNFLLYYWLSFSFHCSFSNPCDICRGSTRGVMVNVMDSRIVVREIVFL